MKEQTSLVEQDTTN